MALVKFINVNQEYSGREVLKNVSFELQAGRKVGLIGPNGSGKTTILRILCSLIKPNEGQVQLTGNVRIGYVPQDVTFEAEQTVFDYLMEEYRKVKARLRAKELAVSQYDQADTDSDNNTIIKSLLNEYQSVRDEYDQMGGDHFERRVKAMLEAMGLADRMAHQVEQLSGGEKNVLSMARALLGEPNLLLLDEPGNHLDYLGLAWLDDFLQRYRGAVLIVSHNRYLLDRVVDGILELDDGKVNYYEGNYTAYRQVRAERLKAQEAQYKAYQQRIEHLERLVQKFADIAQGHSHEQSWGKRLQARRSQLAREKAQGVEKPKPDRDKISPHFKTDPTRADIALQVREYSKGFDVEAPKPGRLELFDSVNWDLAGGQRWALIGPNGCGKTTLLRDIVEQGGWRNPVIRIGPSLSVGYCAQQQEILDGDNTVLEELMEIKDTNHEQVLGILARFLFKDEEVYKQIRYLSGGERNRLQLARLMLLQSNFLILDEPTNHLDIPTREAVEQALAEFKGTILVVSHDRYFLDKVVDHVAEVKDRQLQFFEGNFTQYWENRVSEPGRISGRIAQRAQLAGRDEDTKEKRGGKAWEQRKAQIAVLRKARKAVEKIEQQIHEAESQKERLEQQAAEAFTVGDNQRGQQLSQQFQALSGEIELLYQQWEQAEKELKDVESESGDTIASED